VKTLQIGRTISALLLGAALVAGCDSTTPQPQIIDRIEIVSGDGQSAPVGTALPNPLVIQVSGPNGEPITDCHIAWTVTSGGGSVSSGLTTTGSDGRTFVTWKLGPTSGVSTVSALIKESGVEGYEVSFAAVAL
jgi:hypothetical protein